MAMAAPNGGQASTTTNGETHDDVGINAPPGTVLPPRSQRDKIEKVAAYVGRNGKPFEDKMRAGSSLVGFLEPEDAYHAYYLWRLEEIKQGRGFDEDAQKIGSQKKLEVGFGGVESRAPKPPEEFKFSARMPNISAQDLEIVKLTALYAAKNGRSWITHLSQREAGNYQFDFLRPQHSMNMFFTRLMEQYKDLIEGETVDNGKPQKARIAELEKNVQDRFHILERAKKRAAYSKWLETQKVEKEEKQEKDRVAFAQIDWHDFSVAATITFDERDEHADMPPPRTLNDMQSLSLEEKANMRIDPNRRLEEAMPTFDDYDSMYGHQQQFPAAQMLPPQQAYTPQPPASATPPQVLPYAPPTEVPSLQVERERARVAAKASQQQARVRTDYVPQAQLRIRAQNTSLCSICKQAIPNDELEQHMKIEMLSPEWREQSRKEQHRSSTTNLSTVDVANNLKRLASQRSDLFDPMTGNALSDEEQNRRKRAELGAYDGISQVPNAAALGAMGQQQQAPGIFPPGTDRPDVQEQIRALHNKYKK